MGFCHKDHIAHRTEADGSSSANENRRGAASKDAPATMGCLLQVGMSVPRSSAWVWGVAGAWGRRGWLKPPTPEEGLLDVNHRRGRKKRISRKDAKTPRFFRKKGAMMMDLVRTEIRFVPL